jgi:hypothetical protein
MRLYPEWMPDPVFACRERENAASRRPERPDLACGQIHYLPSRQTLYGQMWDLVDQESAAQHRLGALVSRSGTGSQLGAARIQSGRRIRAMVSGGEVAEQSVEGRMNVTHCSFAVLAGCGTIFRARFQPCKGGDMACVRGPLGASTSPIARHNQGKEVGPRPWVRPLSIIAQFGCCWS